MIRKQHNKDPFKKTEMSTIPKIFSKIDYAGENIGSIFIDIQGVVYFNSSDYNDNFDGFEVNVSQLGIIIVHMYNQSNKQST